MSNKNTVGYYTPLHCHSHASLLDGLSQIPDIIDRAKEIGSKSIALTDHGVIGSSIEFLKEAKDNDIQPIIGCELYVCHESPTIKESGNRKLSHLPVLAKGDAGWKDLIQLISESNKPEHFYYNPRLDLWGLQEYGHRGNLIAFAGHLGSVLSNCVLDGDQQLHEDWLERGIECAKALESIFGKGNFFLEVQLMDYIENPLQVTVANCVRKIAEETGIPTIATPDAHYCRHEDAELQRILLCTNMKTTLEKANKPDFMLNTFFKSDNYHIPTYEEMQGYGHTQEELDNTNKVAEMCGEYNNILQAPQLPHFSCPEGYDENLWLRELCRQGWKDLIKDQIDEDQIQVYVDRVKEELDVFEEANLAGYFLIVKDIVDYIHSIGGILSPGRGSVSGCLTAYLIGITNIDSIEYKLLFSRFYNSARIGTLPDIDLDIPKYLRGQVIEYIKDKYGHNKVGHIITHGRLRGRSSVKDVFRAYGDVSFDEINQITKHIPDKSKIADELQVMEEEEGESSIIQWALENKKKDLQEWCSIDENGELKGPYANRFRQAIALEGTKCTNSKHAAGIIIGIQPLSELCPLVYDPKTKTQIVGLEMGDCESIGLVKMDMLGLAALDKLLDIKQMVSQRGIEYDIHNVSLDCPKTWTLIGNGNTKGLFQLDSHMGASYAKQLKPKNMEHLAALTAIIRPGCLEARIDGKSITQKYMDRKNSLEDVDNPIEALGPILKDNYGLMIYQEDSMNISKDIAGFTLQEADTLRKGIGKKLPEVIAKLKGKFLKGCVKLDKVNTEEAEEIFKWIEKSQRYSFNRSHGFGYGKLGYYTAYAKAHYPIEFYCAYLRMAHTRTKPMIEVYQLVNNARQNDISIKPPNFSKQNIDFKIIDSSVYFGLSNIKGVGASMVAKLNDKVDKVSELLDKGPSKFTWEDYLFHLSESVSSTTTEGFIESGALDCMKGKTRIKKMDEFKVYRKLTKREKEYIRIRPCKNLKECLELLIKAPTGKNGGCHTGKRKTVINDQLKLLNKPARSIDGSAIVVAEREQALLGIAMTVSPVKSYNMDNADTTCLELLNVPFVPIPYNSKKKPKVYHIACNIKSVRQIKTKKGKNPGQDMAFCTVADDKAELSTVVFPEAWSESKSVLIEDNNVILACIKGRDDGCIVQKAYQLEF